MKSGRCSVYFGFGRLYSEPAKTSREEQTETGGTLSVTPKGTVRKTVLTFEASISTLGPSKSIGCLPGDNDPPGMSVIDFSDKPSINKDLRSVLAHLSDQNTEKFSYSSPKVLLKEHRGFRFEEGLVIDLRGNQVIFGTAIRDDSVTDASVVVSRPFAAEFLRQVVQRLPEK
jgi:hypothetical protein